MQYQQKMTRFEKSEARNDMLTKTFHGEGLYIFENKNCELTLPKPTKSGKRVIAPKERFQGDNYFMSLVRNGTIRFIQELQSPEQERLAMQQENEKLILDQPETVTTEGVVERVVKPVKVPAAPINETGKQSNPPAVLLNENPADDGFIIVAE